MGLSHFIEYDCGTVFRGNFKLSADMMFYKFPHKLIIFILHEIVVSYSRTYENTLYTLYFADFSEH